MGTAQAASLSTATAASCEAPRYRNSGMKMSRGCRTVRGTRREMQIPGLSLWRCGSLVRTAVAARAPPSIRARRPWERRNQLKTSKQKVHCRQLRCHRGAEVGQSTRVERAGETARPKEHQARDYDIYRRARQGNDNVRSKGLIRVCEPPEAQKSRAGGLELSPARG